MFPFQYYLPASTNLEKETHEFLVYLSLNELQSVVQLILRFEKQPFCILLVAIFQSLTHQVYLLILLNLGKYKYYQDLHIVF